MFAKQTITLIGTFFYLVWNPGRFVSDIFLFQIGINKQPVKRVRQKIEKQNSFVSEKLNILTLWKNWTPGESLVANKCCRRSEYLKRDLPLCRHDDRLHHRDDRPRYHEDRLHSPWQRQLTVIATVFVVKNRALQAENLYFPMKNRNLQLFPKNVFCC